MTRYVIIGAGAVGASLAAQLYEAGIDQLLVGRGPGIGIIRDRGLTYVRHGVARLVPVSAAAGHGEMALTAEDVLVFATKTQEVETASREWAWRPVAFPDHLGVAGDLPVLTLQNGLAADRIVARRFARVLGGSLMTPARHLEPGRVESGAAGPVGVVTLGPVIGVDDALRDRVAGDLRRAGYSVQTTDDVARWQRAKLLSSVRFGLEVLSGDRDVIADVADHLVTEARQVFAAAELPVADSATERTVDLSGYRRDPAAGFEPGGRSTWQSFRRGAPSEVDYLNGEVALLGRLHGVATPYNEALQRVLGVAGLRREPPGAHDVGEVLALVGQADTTDAGARPAALSHWCVSRNVRERGTVVVLAGRGETPAVYERFGKRLAADAYHVIAVETDPVAGKNWATNTTEVDATVAGLLADPDLVAPVVLVGSDTGVFCARRIADAHPRRVDAIILAGVPAEAAVEVPGGRGAEIAARSACRNHQRVLSVEARTGLFATPVPGLVGAPVDGHGHADLPVLAIHGADDTLSPLARALERYADLGATEVDVVREGRHDILNDITHRSVAATIVLFLERLRSGADLPAIVEVVAPHVTTGILA